VRLQGTWTDGHVNSYIPPKLCLRGGMIIVNINKDENKSLISNQFSIPTKLLIEFL
jgi:hypothetical protein